jgi:hypothetical protein
MSIGITTHGCRKWVDVGATSSAAGWNPAAVETVRHGAGKEHRRTHILAALSRPFLAHSRGRNGMKSGMASSSIFSSISTVLPLSPEISMRLSKSAGS